MQIFKNNDNVRDIKSAQFMKKIQSKPINPVSNFLYNLKVALLSNKFITYVTSVGFGTAIVNTFLLTPYFLNSVLGLFEWAGQLTVGFALSSAIRGNDPIQYKSMNQIHKHMGIGAALLIAGLIGNDLVLMLPYSHILLQFTRTIFFTGINCIFEGGLEKYRR
jgi:hypothetical protein